MKSNSGATLVESLIVLIMMSIAAFAIASLRLELNKISVHSSTQLHLEHFRRNIVTHIENASAWQKTVAQGSTGALFANSKFTCLRDSTPCTVDGSVNGTPITDQPFAIVDASNTVFYDATIPGSGVTPQGQPCTGFGTDPRCPVRYELKWSAVCAPGDCVDPQVRISARYIGMPDTPYERLNPDNYSLAELVK